MEILKIIGIGFLTLIITLTLKEYRKEMAVYSILIGGAIIIYYSLGIITEIIDFLKSILQNSNYNNMFVSVLLKITGIGLLIGRYKKFSRYGVPVYVTNPTQATDKILSVSGVYSIIPKI